MATPMIRIQLSTADSQLVDMTGLADRLLSDLCRKTGLAPFAVLIAALVKLEMSDAE
jgi:hypothetical protein